MYSFSLIYLFFNFHTNGAVSNSVLDLADLWVWYWILWLASHLLETKAGKRVYFKTRPQYLINLDLKQDFNVEIVDCQINHKRNYVQCFSAAWIYQYVAPFTHIFPKLDIFYQSITDESAKTARSWIVSLSAKNTIIHEPVKRIAYQSQVV